MPGSGQKTSKIGTTCQTLKLLELSSEDAEFSSVTSSMACAQNSFFSIFSERYMSSTVRLSSVTFVRPTQAIEIFGNIFMLCGTLAIHDLCVKILRRSSQGNPSVGGVKHKRGSRL